MADVVLSAELQARVDSFVANLLAAANSANNTSNSVSQMSTNISRNVANVNRVNLSQFTAAMNAGTLSVQRLGAAVPAIVRPLTVGSNQAAMALTNLGRVAQDAPFGFIGIQNNLNPLLESFQRLRAETGSNAAAFRALGSSLLGPAGIGIALSVISSAILIYQQYQQKAAKETANSEAAMRKAKKSSDEYAQSLDVITRSRLVGSQAAQKELTELTSLYSIAENTTISLKQRLQAVDELQKKYPEYFKNLEDETVLNGGAKEAYDRLSKAILATARARAAQDIITKNSSRQLENEQKQIDLQRERIKLLSKQDKLQKTVDAGIGSAERGDASGAKEAIQLIKVNGLVDDSIKSINNLKTDSKLLNEQNLRLEKEITKQVKDGADLAGKVGDMPKDIKPKRIDLLLPDNPKDLIKKFFNEISSVNASGALTVKAPENLKIQGELKKVDLGQLFQFDSADLDKAIENLKLQQKLNDIVIGAQQEIVKLTNLPSLIDATAGALSQSFSAMGDAIASGGDVLAAAGGVIQQTFADLLAALGKQFITMGAAKIAAGILASPFGGKLIADGAGLIALGAGLSLGGGVVGGAGKGKASGGVTAFADGGIISGPTLGLMGEYAGAKSDPEVVAPLSKLKNLLGETDDSGNVISKNRNEPIVLVADTVIRGQDIVTSYRKASGTRNRQG